ncbi:hypothetical protein Vca1114GL_01108 [Vibrio campbellii]|nr:GlyGly-CTERM sorting domain-containing protein [Vibrio campbellii]AQM67626.1 hypothetical protein Vca1114GL_01108 [Vibrio campbellii]
MRNRASNSWSRSLEYGKSIIIDVLSNDSDFHNDFGSSGGGGSVSYWVLMLLALLGWRRRA